MRLNDLTWQQRRELAYKLYRGTFTDSNLPYTIIENQSDDELVVQVLDFFENGSELIYPAKFIFCNIVYSYYLAKYFNCDFNAQIRDINTIPDSPCVLAYNDRPNVYKRVLDVVYPVLESYTSIDKTRKYFKMEFLIDDEDISEVCPINFVKSVDR